MLRRLFVLCCFALAAAVAKATEEQSAEEIRSLEESNLFFSRFHGMFDFDLPDIDDPGTVKLILHPHFGDLVNRDYLRTTVGFRWAINEHWEVSADTLTYFTHGLGHKSIGDDSADNGLGEWGFGAKYLFHASLPLTYQADVALNVSLPGGAPPLDLTDGHRHIVPTFTIQHYPTRNPKLATFANFSLDLVSPSHVPGAFYRNEPHDDSVSFSAGGLYDLRHIKLTLAATYTTTALISGHPESFFSVRPGILWFVPKRYTLNSKTQWIIGLGARGTIGPDGTDFSIGSRVRAEITFRQVIDKMRGRDTPKPGENAP